MGGGVSMPAVPVSASTEAALKKLYDEKKAAGEEDDAINAALAAATPAVIVFNQIDIDGSGSIDTSELHQSLLELGLELGEEKLAKLAATADADASGQIDEAEFVDFFR